MKNDILKQSLFNFQGHTYFLTRCMVASVFVVSSNCLPFSTLSMWLSSRTMLVHYITSAWDAAFFFSTNKLERFIGVQITHCGYYWHLTASPSWLVNLAILIGGKCDEAHSTPRGISSARRRKFLPMIKTPANPIAIANFEVRQNS